MTVDLLTVLMIGDTDRNPYFRYLEFAVFPQKVRHLGPTICALRPSRLR